MIYDTINSIIDNSKMSNSDKFDAIAQVYAADGYVVTVKEKDKIQLVKEKKFNYKFAFAGTMLFGIGLLLYFIYYTFEEDKTVNIYFVDNTDNKQPDTPLHQDTKIRVEKAQHVANWFAQWRRDC